MGGKENIGYIEREKIDLRRRKRELKKKKIGEVKKI